ncbi:hypothetical protein JCM11641_001093 [Rhodosporidiobolus odoratus]
MTTPSSSHHHQTPSKQLPATPSKNRSPSSPFSATPISLTKPPLARLPPSQLSPHPAHPTVESSHDSNPEQRRDNPSTQDTEIRSRGRERMSLDVGRVGNGDPASSTAGLVQAGSALPGSKRRSSLGSLQGILERDEASRSSGKVSAGRGGVENFGFLRRNGTAGTRQASGRDLPPVEDEADGLNAKDEVGQLSWGTKWWPFSVVDPAASTSSSGNIESTEPSTMSAPLPLIPQTKAQGHEAEAGLLSFFAGKKTVQSAREKEELREREEEIEAELLGADVEALQKHEFVDERVRRLERVEEQKALPQPPQPQRRGSLDKRKGKASFLPSSFSLFSQPSLSSSPESATASIAPFSEITSHAASSSSSTAAQSNPISLLSSLTLTNPFTSSPSSSSTLSSAGNLFSTSRLPSSSSSLKPTHARSFSSTSLTRRHSAGDADPSQHQGSELGKKQVKGMVDEGDKEAVEEGVEENDDIYSVLKERYKAPRLPTVFCHGLFGFDHIGPSLPGFRFSYWIGVEEALTAMGAEVLIGRVPASASIEERARVLCDLIEERFPGREVNLIGHSMGGLDGRYLISRLRERTFRVRSLTTISTPHRGSSFADYLLEDVLGAERVPAFLALMRGLGVPGGGKAFDDLTTTKMAKFNEDTPDDPEVKYYSYGAEFEATWSNPFYIPYGVIAKREGANDGLVSLSSAKWGNYIATLHNVNHLDLVGWVGKGAVFLSLSISTSTSLVLLSSLLGANPLFYSARPRSTTVVVRYGFAELMGRPIKFKPITFYSAIAERLAEEGF